MMRRMMARRRNGISIHMMDVQNKMRGILYGWQADASNLSSAYCRSQILVYSEVTKGAEKIDMERYYPCYRTHLFILHSSDAHSSMNHDVPAPVMLTRLLITNSPEIQSGTSCHGCLKLATPAAVAGSGEDTTVKGASALQHDAATIIYAFPVASVPAGDCIIFFFFIAWWQSHGIQPEEWIRVDRDGSRLTAAAVVRSKAYLWKREIAH
ncbi:hypothetical protein MUK42_03001 [Musa troglodytarum]|uniref:Uncharacterized protein n=1 Tax=Musa troglodytarum TaxID=320322 RepID=A0A9E7JGT7_9LILI|nr:hypothetical protein MUK42_02638 [Musa troglodytarum]URD80623.1 hypothetical protein MUK42_03001 [Musa troglodytarum]